MSKKIVIVYFSGYGHTKRMAETVAQGAGGELLAIDAPASVPALYLRHLEREPSLVVASQWMQGQSHTPAGLQKALDRAVKPLLRYRCAACGFEASQHFWQCPGCQARDSYPARRVEEL